jgi:23S rRNA pseudouridine955/2504/2580 synthase
LGSSAGREASPEPAADFDPERILFHGAGLLVVDKPGGIAVHRGTAHELGLVEILEEWVRRNPGAIDIRPGKRILPIHRLDLEASGVLLLALKRSVARQVQTAFSAGEVRKRYLACIAGPLPESGRLSGRVRSRLRSVYRHLPAELSFRRLRGDERLSLVEVEPGGGRTHQIRALFAQAGRPLAGDLRYGRPKPARQFLEKFALPHLLLHALELELPESIRGVPRRFEAPLPESFQELCRRKGWQEL